MKFSTRQIIEDYGTDGSGVIFEVTNHLRTAVARGGGAGTTDAPMIFRVYKGIHGEGR